MNRRCVHAPDQIRKAREMVRDGRLADALDAYLAILAEHPIGQRCRARIAQAAAELAFDLGCFLLALRLAGAAVDETNQWPVPRRRRAAAWLMMGRAEAWLDDDDARETLSGASLPGRWPWTLRRRARMARTELSALTSTADLDTDLAAEDAARRYRTTAPVRRARPRAVHQVGYAAALATAGRKAEAAAHFAAAATALAGHRAVRRWRSDGVVPRRPRARQAAAAWASAVAGRIPLVEVTALGAEVVEAGRPAIALLNRLSMHVPAARSAARLAERAQGQGDTEAVAVAVEEVTGAKSEHICWYLDETVVRDWADAVVRAESVVEAVWPDRDIIDIGWLTRQSGPTVLARMDATFTALGHIDAENFVATAMLALKSMAIHIDRIGLPQLALAAARREVATLRDLIVEHGDEAREDLAWATQRLAVCLRDAGVTEGLVDAWTEAALLHQEFGHVRAADRAYQRISDVHLEAGDWRATAAAAAGGALRVAAMTDSPPLAAVDEALANVEAEVFAKNWTAAIDGLTAERTELARVMATWDPGAHSATYVRRLIGRARSQNVPEDEARDAVEEAVAVARTFAAVATSVGEVVLTDALAAHGLFELDHGRPVEALAPIDETIARYQAAIGSGQRKHGDLAVALAHRRRCVKALGREDEEITALRDEYSATREALATDRRVEYRAYDIADALWDLDQVDLAVDVISDAIVAERSHPFDRPRQYALRALYFARLGQPTRALNDLDSAAEIAGDAFWLRVRRARVLSLIGRRSDALEQFAALAAERPTRTYVRRMVGLIKLESGDDTGALADLIQAVRLDPDSGSNRIAVTYAYIATGDADSAAREGHLAVDLIADESEAHYVYGAALMFQGHWTEGHASLEYAVGLVDPGNSSLSADRLAHLAVYTAARGDGRTAFDTLRRCVDLGLTPETTDYVRTQLRILTVALPGIATACEQAIAAIG